MLRLVIRALAFAALVALGLMAQIPERAVGTVAAIAADKSSIEIKPQNGGPQISVQITAETILQQVAPGEKNLKNATPVLLGDIAIGDRVLVNADPATSTARRIVVMPASAIAEHDEADRANWSTRGISGVVVAKNGQDITLRQRSMMGDTQAHVEVSATTRFKKYAPDSVKFADAQPSSLTDVKVGDQLRVRGDKSEDGLHVKAEDIVFGTFVTKAGTITAIDAEHKTVTLKELNTNATLSVKLSPDSQIKQMPDFGGMAGGPPGGIPAGPPPGATMSGGRPPDMAQMIEHMPSVGLTNIKAGDTVVMSSTKGANENEYTAIVLLDNAGMLIRMATAGQRSNDNSRGNVQQGGQPGVQGMGGIGGLGNLELPGMMQ